MQTNTEFEIDEKDFVEGIYEDMGSIIQMLYPNSKLFLKAKEGGKIQYSINKEVDIDQLKLDIKSIHLDAKMKRMEKMNTTECKVIKIGTNYYILDGNKKVPIFE